MIKVVIRKAELQKIERLVEKLKKVERGIKDRKRPLELIKRRQVQRFMMNFTSEGEIYETDGGWWDLADRTVDDREQHIFRGWSPTWRGDVGPTNPILVRRGETEDSVERQANAAKIKSSHVLFKLRNDPSNEAYPLSLHLGYSNPNPRAREAADIPPRTIYDINDEDRTAVDRIAEAHIDAVINKYFR